MKNKINKKKPYQYFVMLIALSIILSFLLISQTIFAEEKQCWICNTVSNRCIVSCNYDICYYWECSQQPICMCDGTSNNSSDTGIPEITLISPTPGQNFSDSFLLTATVSEKVKLYYKLDGGVYILLCSNCNYTSTVIPLTTDGHHILTVKAVDSAYNSKDVSVEFYSDSVLPKIIKWGPESDSFSKGNFWIKYTEEQNATVELYYKSNEETDYKVYTAANCGTGKYIVCNFTADLSAYDGKEITYYIKVKDIVNAAQTTPRKIKIDYKAPNITILNPISGTTYNTRTINFDIQLDEKATLYMKQGNRTTTLCAGCTGFSGSRTLNEGYQGVEIIAIDQVGNIASKTVYVRIDSKPPVIKNTIPTDYGYGLFGINFDEKNLKHIKLHYRKVGAPQWTTMGFGCISDNYCEVNVDLSQYNGQELEYYFTIEDYYTTKSSQIKRFIVDTQAPQMTLSSPVSTIYSTKKILFSATVNKEVEIYYYLKSSPNITKSLCTKCNAVNKEITLPEGDLELVVVAEDRAGNKNTKEIRLTVDVTPPKILKFTPETGATSNGKINISYDELSLREVAVFYRYPGDTFQKVVVTGCAKGKKMSCTTDLNLAAFQNQNIEYYIQLKDDLNSVASEVRTIKVDEYQPQVQILSPTTKIYTINYLPIAINANEVVDLYYSKNGGTYYKLCSKCTSFSTKKSFPDGTNILQVKAIDLAGNTATASVTFKII